ncbi:hypothetical protein ACF064_27045 [Streptomyces sp. NPDC015492]
MHPHGWAPRWLNLSWSSLALFDTLATVLLLRGRRRGSTSVNRSTWRL